MRKTLLIMLLCTPFAVLADSFFMAADAGVTECMWTEKATLEKNKRMIEESMSVNCAAQLDTAGTQMLTCKSGSTIIMFYFTKDDKTCQSLHKSILTLLNS